MEPQGSQKRSLYARAIRAGGWSVAAHGTDTAVRLLSSLILTRLLFPEAFGLIAAATSILVGLTLVSDIGIRTSILRSPLGEQDDFLHSAWVLQSGRGIALWLILIVLCALLSSSPARNTLPVASVYADPQFPYLAAVLGFSLVLSGLESTSVHLNLRRINLGPIFFLDLVGRFLSLPITILAAWLSGSVWAVVGGSLLSSVIRLAMSHVLVPGPRMALRWNRNHIQEFAGYGKWIGVSSTATFVGRQSDRIVMGLLLPGSTLGLYSIAKVLIEALDGLFERLSGSLAVPVLGEVVRRDLSSLKDRYYRFRLPFDLTAPLLAGVIFVIGSLVAKLLFDKRYINVGPMLQILAVGLVFYPSLLISNVFPLVGQARVAAIGSIAQALSLLVCVFVGFRLSGAMGVVGGVAIHKIIPSAFILTISYRRGWVDLLKELRVVPVFLLGLIVGNCILFGAKHLGL